MTAVGNSVARKDGIGKATGSARYADDITFPGMIHGRTIRSTIPRGRVLAAGATIDEAARVLSREIAPIDDLRSTAE